MTGYTTNNNNAAALLVAVYGSLAPGCGHSFVSGAPSYNLSHWHQARLTTSIAASSLLVDGRIRRQEPTVVVSNGVGLYLGSVYCSLCIVEFCTVKTDKNRYNHQKPSLSDGNVLRRRLSVEQKSLVS